ncbi:MAG: aspartate 1-decarboxylase [bacterium]
MQVQVMKSKIHRATVTDADLHYEGSISIDSELVEAANMLPNEKVQVLDINNGERFETYVIPVEAGSGEICLNGAAARKVEIGDLVIIISYALMDYETAKKNTPQIVKVDENNRKLN